MSSSSESASIEVDDVEVVDLADADADHSSDDASDDGDRDALAESADHGERGGRRRPSKARLDLLEQEGEIAADYLEGLLDIADLDGDIDMDVEGDRAAVSVVGAELTHLVGRGGSVLDAIQELTRLAVLRATGERSRLMLDISGFRAGRRTELTQLGAEACQTATKTGEQVRLAAMTPFERKVVHDAVAAAGLRSESDGEEPNRRVVVYPAQ